MSSAPFRVKSTLSKGRFVSACECATKLYYKCHSDEYLDGSSDDDFLRALAEGGFQVGELAKFQFAGGIDHTPIRNPEESWRQLQAAVAAARPGEKLRFYEPTILTGNLIVRADILDYCDGEFVLREVKSKSFDGEGDPFLYQSGEGIIAAWKPYLLDLTFQALVIERAFPGSRVRALLVAADKSRTTTVDGLNQLFKLTYDSKRGRVDCVPAPGITPDQLGSPLLSEIDAQTAREYLLQVERFPGGRSFAEWVDFLEGLVREDRRAPPVLCSSCKDCEFRVDTTKIEPGLKSGFLQCWSEASGLSDEDLRTRELVLDIWKLRSAVRESLIEEGIFLMEEVDPDLLVSKAEKKGKSKPGQGRIGALSESQRRVLQVEKVKDGDAEPYLHRDGLRAELAEVQWPAHLIDFETSRVAIPFHRGQRPYGQLAFQFSHHLLHEDGRLEHRDEFLEATPGVFPNFEFGRALRRALGDQGGSIFMYSSHERTVLNEIFAQLDQSTEPDRQELQDWIRSFVPEKGAAAGTQPKRRLIDLLEWVKKWWYHPATHGSNSIKQVLPVILQEGGSFEATYSKPLYGAPGPGGIPSLNFQSKTLLRRDAQGRAEDLYHGLPPIFSPDDPMARVDHPARIFFSETVQEGGAAMQAYARLQFTEMTDQERRALKQALLRYCELDTLAMGFVLLYFREKI